MSDIGESLQHVVLWVTSHDWAGVTLVYFLLGIPLSFINAAIASRTGKNRTFFGWMSIIPFMGFFILVLLIASREDKAPLRTFFEHVLHDPFWLVCCIMGALVFALGVVSDMIGSVDILGHLSVGGMVVLAVVMLIRNGFMRRKRRRFHKARAIMNESAKKSELN